MKYKFFLFCIVLIIQFHTSCKNNETEESFDEVIRVQVEYEINDICEFEAKKCLFPILDSLIKKQNKLSDTISENIVCFLSIRKENNDTLLSFELKNLNRFYCELVNAILIYKSHFFIYHGEYYESLFTKTTRKRKIKCRKSDLFLYDIDDRAYFIWWYKIENGIISDYFFNQI